ncbi:uncharacterized protein LOC112341458 isoform X2 [Selaginella moellendorffii]|uniref:uncharacterized protein LOC112341458 isoform X2 n=1 Tax=Selaginella moellendorffii TaxID=88036 RepID=UPI000D1CCC8D|nr:uncharacterized protein LOC112341458 isoform X2 [Selaginella moellendorffii]|eukprot:XP_024517342.1 uncharacterized protein LOC112341458 isoform X2 [Selaginella moellendorffii]
MESSSEAEERRLAAAHALTHYSPFAMTCIGESVTPSQLRLHLLQELSGMPSTLKTPGPSEIRNAQRAVEFPPQEEERVKN